MTARKIFTNASISVQTQSNNKNKKETTFNLQLSIHTTYSLQTK